MKVLLADDHRLLLEGLQNLLTAHGIEVVGLAYDGNEAVSLARQLKPDVVLMDIRMPLCDGLCATKQICAEMPEIKIIILTTSTEEQDLFEAIKSGACGYLLKNMDADELVECLNQAQQGLPPFSPGLANKILSEFTRLGADKIAAEDALKAQSEVDLTPRQRQVLSLLAQGYSYKEAGQKLGLSPRTIKYHMSEIIERLHLENRSQVLAAAGRLGLKGTGPDRENQPL
ncbi:MAG: response regulator transcription factor [Anaerolineae bacterium]|nr:response regulator transcription factor [Anaerolineae bacterium]